MTTCDCRFLYLPAENMIQEINRRILPEHTMLDLSHCELDAISSGENLARIFTYLANHPNITTLNLSYNELGKMKVPGKTTDHLRTAFAAMPHTIKTVILANNLFTNLNGGNLSLVLSSFKHDVEINLQADKLTYGSDSYRKIIREFSATQAENNNAPKINGSLYYWLTEYRALTIDWHYKTQTSILYNFRKQIAKEAAICFGSGLNRSVPHDVWTQYLEPYLTVVDAARLKLVCKPLPQQQ